MINNDDIDDKDDEDDNDDDNDNDNDVIPNNFFEQSWLCRRFDEI